MTFPVLSLSLVCLTLTHSGLTAAALALNNGLLIGLPGLVPRT